MTQEILWEMIRARKGVPMLMGKPATAKSAKLKQLAEEKGLQYIYLNLATVAETEVGIYPHLIEEDGMKYLEYAIPMWAKRANERPTLIHFEELNRCSKAVRDACLQILNERTVAYNYPLNEGVYMAASGNLGEEDGTEVDDLDSAVSSRLIKIPHTLELTEWLAYAKKADIHPDVINYLEANPSSFFREETKDGSPYANPRTWDFLSEFCKTIDQGENYIPTIRTVGHCYVGQVAVDFVKYLVDSRSVTVADVLDNFPKVKHLFAGEHSRALASAVMVDLRALRADKFTKKQVKNLNAFLAVLDRDERMGYLLYLVDAKCPPKEKEAPLGPEVDVLLKPWKEDLIAATEVREGV